MMSILTRITDLVARRLYAEERAALAEKNGLAVATALFALASTADARVAELERELGEARAEIVTRKARAIELETECARLDASATAARIAKGVREIERDEAREDLAKADAVLEQIQRALGAWCAGDLARDVAALVASRCDVCGSTSRSAPAAVTVERAGDEEVDDVG